MTRPTVDEQAWDLLHQALEVYHDHPDAAEALRHQVSRFQEPLRVAVAGRWRAGKSTLVNALVGEEVAPVGSATGCEVFTWYQDGTVPYAVAYPPGCELPVSRSTAGIAVDSSGWRPAAVNDIVVTLPARTLRHATLVDTPAVAVGDGQPGEPAVAAERIVRETDAVLYLAPDGHGADQGFLACAPAGAVARAAPVNLVLVLSRADEIGGGRVDALLSARQLARRAYREPRVRFRCLTAVAVSGLVALAGRVLSEPDFSALSALTGLPRDDLTNLLLSADRFADPAAPVPVPVEARRALLERLGVVGVRLATTLIRTGSDSRAKLAGELVQRAGLSDLRETVARCFTDRRELLKARSALVALESLLRREPRPGAGPLLARLEQVVAGAHDFRELRLLAALQSQRLGLDPDASAEARRLVGGDGTSVPARLGVDDRAPAAELWRLTCDALARWQERSEDPTSDLEQQRAARVVVRSCEGMAAAQIGD